MAGRTAPALGRDWLVSPWFDALFIANVAWPLLLVAQIGEGFSGPDGLRFWQIYFITTPHRWITLALVFFDRERFGERRMAFLGVAVALAAVCIGVQLSTGTLTCLLAIDYVWNAWHFAAQHHGIYRIYGRMNEPARTRGLFIEKWALRLFLLYVIVRVAGATWPAGYWESWLYRGDWIAAIVPLGLIGNEFARSRSGAAGQRLYLVSVSALYLALLWAVHMRRPGLVLSLATASALFHAIEYLALVTLSVRRRHAERGVRLGLLGYLAPRFGIALAVFLLILGSLGWLLDQHWLRTWLLINVVVAFWHYAYDGMIWRQRPSLRPPRSAALSAGAPSG